MSIHDNLYDAHRKALHKLELEGLGEFHSGKVREVYIQEKQCIMVTTDRVSAFDRVLGVIPYKGQILNQLSVWWFGRLADIMPNHLIAMPDPNVMVVRKADIIPIEVVVRGYLTGSTSTSLWTLYEQGERNPYGLSLPEGMQKNDALPQPVLTPTTKAVNGQHDQPISREEIIEQGIVGESLWEEIEARALGLFEAGQHIATEAGLILVDTKYEFGMIDGKLTLVDECHTPDSSRYWSQASYEGGRPEPLSKEMLREWYALQGYKGEGEPAPLRPELAALVAGRYIAVYESLTGEQFISAPTPAAERIARALETYRIS